jgi:predicted RNA-binding Zn ribbon-like protein
MIRDLIERQKTGKASDPSRLNAFLAKARSYLALVRGEDGHFHLDRSWENGQVVQHGGVPVRSRHKAVAFRKRREGKS